MLRTRFIEVNDARVSVYGWLAWWIQMAICFPSAPVRLPGLAMTCGLSLRPRGLVLLARLVYPSAITTTVRVSLSSRAKTKGYRTGSFWETHQPQSRNPPVLHSASGTRQCEFYARNSILSP